MLKDNDQRNKIRLLLFGTFVVSVLLLVVIDIWHEYRLAQFFIKLLDALAISAIIGLFLEEALLREFGRDVFLASIGYLLPKELQPEMVWLSNLKVLCTGDVMRCNLALDGQSVKFHVHRTQVVQNISHRLYELPIGLGIDEWFRREGASRIIKFSLLSEVEGKGASFEHDFNRTDFGMNLPKEAPTVYPLEKGEKVTIISEFEEFYPRNGYFFMHIKYATRGATVTIDCPSELGVYAEFAHRIGTKYIRQGNDYVCPFTLLPYQRVAVRFWDKKQAAERQSHPGLEPSR